MGMFHNAFKGTYSNRSKGGRTRWGWEGAVADSSSEVVAREIPVAPATWLPENAREWAGDEAGGPAFWSAGFFERALPALDFLAKGGDRELVAPWFDGTLREYKPKSLQRLLDRLEDSLAEKAAAKAVAKAAATPVANNPFAALKGLVRG